MLSREPFNEVPRVKGVLVLEGAADVILFDDCGAIRARHRLGAHSPHGRIWVSSSAPALAYDCGEKCACDLFRGEASKTRILPPGRQRKTTLPQLRTFKA